MLRGFVGVKRADSLAREVGSTKVAVARDRKLYALATSESRRIDGLTEGGGIVGSAWVFGAREIWRMGSERRWAAVEMHHTRIHTHLTRNDVRRGTLSGGESLFWVISPVRNSSCTSLPTWNM